MMRKKAPPDTTYFKIYAPFPTRRQLHIEAMDAGQRTSRYCREIIDERLPTQIRTTLRERALLEGRTVQDILLAALLRAGVKEAAPCVDRKGPRKHG